MFKLKTANINIKFKTRRQNFQNEHRTSNRAINL